MYSGIVSGCCPCCRAPVEHLLLVQQHDGWKAVLSQADASRTLFRASTPMRPLLLLWQQTTVTSTANEAMIAFSQYRQARITSQDRPRNQPDRLHHLYLHTCWQCGLGCSWAELDMDRPIEHNTSGHRQGSGIYWRADRRRHFHV